MTSILLQAIILKKFNKLIEEIAPMEALVALVILVTLVAQSKSI